MIRRFIPLFLSLVLAVFAFAACGGDASSSSDAASVSSEAASSEASEPASEESEAPADSGVDPEQAQHDVNATLAAIADGASLGETIELRELELTSGGIDLTGVTAWSAAESQMASENGGIVMVFEVDAANVAGLKTSLEAFRDAKVSDDRYAEYAEAREHTQNARIVDSGNMVIYAVSATGDNDALDAAISGATA